MYDIDRKSFAIIDQSKSFVIIDQSANYCIGKFDNEEQALPEIIEYLNQFDTIYEIVKNDDGNFISWQDDEPYTYGTIKVSESVIFLPDTFTFYVYGV